MRSISEHELDELQKRFSKGLLMLWIRPNDTIGITCLNADQSELISRLHDHVMEELPKIIQSLDQGDGVPV